MPDVAIIIPTLNGGKLLAACLRSCVGLETVVVYNGPAARHPLGVERTGRLALSDYQFERNEGFAVACNKGADLALGAHDYRWLLFLNDDTELVSPNGDGWAPVETMVRYGEEVLAGIVGARLVYPSGDLQHAGVYLTVAGGKIVEGHHYLEERPSGPVLAVTGAAMLVRSDVWRRLGGFDIGYYNGNEDVDLCLRAAALGERVAYCAEATITHHESASGAERWVKVTENVRRLSERWASALASAVE